MSEEPTRSTLNILGRPWYYRLYTVDSTRGLFSFHREETLEGKLIVQFEAPETYSHAKRLYSLFQNISEYLSYVDCFPPTERCFYETILGRFRQKAHFDIDFEGTEESNVRTRANALLVALCNAVSSLLYEHGITMKKENFVIYTSHGKKGDKYKCSFHLLIDGYYHNNNIEACSFYEELMQRMYNVPDRENIDHAVYGSIQQFRILGSQKYLSYRPKVPYGGMKEEGYFERIKTYRRSIVGDCGDCLPLPSFVKAKAYTYDQDTHLSEEECNAVEALVLSHNYTRECTSIREIRGGLVILQREYGSTCPVCRRVHEGENPYLIVTRSGEVLFSCRRSEDKCSMGSIVRTTASAAVNEDEEEEEEVKEEAPPIVTLPPMRRVNILEYTKNRVAKTLCNGSRSSSSSSSD